MSNLISLRGCDLSRFVPDLETETIVSDVIELGREKDIDILLCLPAVSGKLFEVIYVNPRKPISIPVSENGKKTQVRFAGTQPLFYTEGDVYSNNVMELREDSVVEVVFYTKKNPEGRVKTFTTVKNPQGRAKEISLFND